MKKSIIVLAIILMISTVSVFADNKGTIGSIDDTIGVNADIGPYAAVVPQKLQWEVEYWWVFPHHLGWDEVGPGMDFATFSGNPDDQSRVRDSNCFLVETNCAVDVTFDGTPLTHIEDSNVTLPTTYWAWESWGVDELPLETSLIGSAKQIIPFNEVGYFGNGLDIPKNNLDFSPPFGNFLDTLLQLAAYEIWPTSGEVASSQSYDGITEKGLYAFQVFGFTGMRDNISDVKAGDYLGEIRLTVAASN